MKKHKIVFALFMAVILTACSSVGTTAKIGSTASEPSTLQSYESSADISADQSDEAVADHHKSSVGGVNVTSIEGKSSEANRVSGSAESKSTDKRSVISKLVTKNRRTYVEYLDDPYLMYGVQIRIDNLIASGIDDPGKWEENFQKAKEVGFRSVIIAISWVEFEIVKDEFDFWFVSLFVKWCDKYDLDLHLIWFGSDVCGAWTNVPKYLWDDPVTYPRADFAPATKHLKYDSPGLIARESNAVKALFDWLEKNDKNHRVSMFQLNNEPDGAGDMDNIPWNASHEEMYKYLWGGGQAEGSIKVMDKLGQTVKASGNKVVTRVNFVNTILDNSVNVARKNLRKTFDMPGVDIVGIDEYSRLISVQERFMDYVNAEIPSGNVTHVPEASGAQENMINKIMNAFSRGEGYLIYEIRTAYGQINDGGVYRQPSASNRTEWVERDGSKMLPGFYTNDWDPKPENVTSEVKSFNNLIYKASHKLATLHKDSISAFNIENKSGSYLKIGEKCGKYTLSYTSPVGGEAMAMCDINGDIILLALYNSSKFTISGKSLSGNASEGYFSKSGVWTQNKSVTVSGDTVTLSAGQCLRIPAGNIK